MTFITRKTLLAAVLAAAGPFLGCGDDDDDDGGTMPDAASTKDAGRLDGATTEPPLDASTTKDAAVLDDARVATDSGTTADAAPPETDQDGGMPDLHDAGSAPACVDGPCKQDGSACSDQSDCASGHCVDGLCCDSACGDSMNDCQACSRALTGEPDGTCAPLPASTMCRTSAGACDFAEVCDGTSPACPGDVVLPAGIVCRSASDVCDQEETCTGNDAVCPEDSFRAPGTACRPAAGPCDLADTCTGSSPSCADVFRSASFVCNAAVIGFCDTPDYCTGSSASCVEQFLSGVECRPGVSACDLTEVCAGTSALCPPDQVIPAGIVCRTSVNAACDPAESCDGYSPYCPANVETCP